MSLAARARPRKKVSAVHKETVYRMGDGLSLVYSFFDTRDTKRSLGIYTILDHIQQARAAGYAHVYLGYWIPGSDKMHYKAEFRPLELLLGGEWRAYEPVQF